MYKIRLFRIPFGLGLLLLALALSGCQSLQYYRQAIQGQCHIWSRERPIAQMLADPQTPAPLEAKLRLVLELRAYAQQELKLPADGHYKQYADLGRRYVVWNVHAAPELSLQPKRWWYPFVGRLKYRGYFSEPYARACGAKLARDHYDVYVGGVEAYSTLGWFHDPVLNTWINKHTADVAEILFHELAHQRVFTHGDTDFNEAFATAVAQEGVRRWLRAKGNTNDYQDYLAHLRHNGQFVRLVMATRAHLQAVYGEQDPEDDSAAPPPKLNLSDEQKRLAKARIMAGLAEQYRQLKSQWGGDTTFDRWFIKPVNNARLNTVSAYYRWVPAFAALLDKNGANLEWFYQAAARLARLSQAERQHTLEALLPQPPQTQSLAARGAGRGP